MSIVTPAILVGSRKEFEASVARFAMVPAIKRIQLDVVDGKFAQPASWPFTAVPEFRELLAKGQVLPLLGRFEYEIDLMVLEPESAIQAFISAGASRIIIHAESTTALGRLLSVVRRDSGYEKGFTPELLSVGLALDIATDTALIAPYIDQIDFVQFMGIAKIGRQKEPFDTAVLPKIRAFQSKYPQMPLQLDGGVTLQSAPGILASGVSTLVVGHALGETSNVSAVVESFDSLVSSFAV